MATIEELNTKDWLNRAFRADKKAKALERLVQQRREDATGLVRASDGNDKGKCSGSKNGTESALMRLADVEALARESKAEADAVSAEIFEAINKHVKDDELAAVLINRYLNYMTIEQVAEFMGYGTATVNRKITAAIKKLIRNDIE